MIKQTRKLLKKVPQQKQDKIRAKAAVVIVGILVLLIVALGADYYFVSHNSPLIAEKHFPKALPFNTKDTLMMTIPSDCDFSSTAYFSNNGHQIAYICNFVKNNYSGSQAIVNDKRQNIFGTVNPGNFIFDNETSSYAYLVQGGNIGRFAPNTNDQDIVVLNGSVVGKYRAWGVSLLYDGQKEEPLLSNGHVGFTHQEVPNGFSDFIYDRKSVSPENIYEFAFAPTVSKDGKHYAFYGEKKGNGTTYSKAYFVLDGKETKVNGFIWNIRLNKDGSHFTYILDNDSLKEESVIHDGISGKEYSRAIGSSSIDFDKLVMSTDGSHIAYIANVNGNGFWVIDNKEYTDFSTTLDYHTGSDNRTVPSQFIFSPDGKKDAFTAGAPDSSYAHPLQMVVENGIAGKRYEEVFNLQYSNDSSTLSYGARNGNVLYVVVNNVATTIGYSNGLTALSLMAISPNGKHVVYNMNNNRDMTINGKLVGSYDAVFGPISFSPDGKYVGYGMREGNQLWWVVKNLSQY